MATAFELLRTLKQRKQFVPFRIVSAGGDKYTVDDWFRFAVSDAMVIYCYPASDRFVRLKKDEIAGVEVITQKPAA
jgi:hypothetical protein